jgi:cytoskeletal protein CcmA (bactofilin family)
MFHRQRNAPTLQSAQPVEEVTVDVATIAPVQVQNEPAEAPVTFNPPQPTQKKEAEPMSNNNPNFASDSSADQASVGAPSYPAAQVPGAASFTPQRGGMQPVVRSPYAGYTPAYGTGTSATTDIQTASGRRLVIGEGITMSGEIEACDHLIVEGTVEATLKGASVLDVAQTGMFFGAVEISEATIAGRFEGDVVVNGRLTVKSTGTIIGTLAYKELAVEAGATIDGKINPMREGKIVTSEKKSPNAKAVRVTQSNDASSELPLASRVTATAAE